MRRRAPALIGGAAACIAALLVFGGGAGAQPAQPAPPAQPAGALEDVLLDDVGYGFGLDGAASGPIAAGYQRTFTHPRAELQIVANDLFPGSSPDEVVAFLGGALAGTFQRVPTDL